MRLTCGETKGACFSRCFSASRGSCSRPGGSTAASASSSPASRTRSAGAPAGKTRADRGHERGSFPIEHGAHGAGVGADESERQRHQIVDAGFDLRQVQALEDRDAARGEAVVAREFLAVEGVHRVGVEADEHDAAVGEPVGELGRQVPHVRRRNGRAARRRCGRAGAAPAEGRRRCPGGRSEGRSPPVPGRDARDHAGPDVLRERPPRPCRRRRPRSGTARPCGPPCGGSSSPAPTLTGQPGPIFHVRW